MRASARTLEEIRRTGLGALARELGLVGMVRFLQQFETGSGDYSIDRHSWLEKSDVRTLTKRIQQGRGEHRAARAIESRLTARERQILEFLVLGIKNKEIADKLSISTSAAHNQVHKLLIKIGAKNRKEAAKYASHLSAAEKLLVRTS